MGARDIWFGWYGIVCIWIGIGLPWDRDCIGINGTVRDRASCRFSARRLWELNGSLCRLFMGYTGKNMVAAYGVPV
jgi:hypothetical protein